MTNNQCLKYNIKTWENTGNNNDDGTRTKIIRTVSNYVLL